MKCLIKLLRGGERCSYEEIDNKEGINKMSFPFVTMGTKAGLTLSDKNFNLSSGINITVEKEACDEDWVCEEWNMCLGGKRERSCYDKNKCATSKDKPNITEQCVSDNYNIIETDNPAQIEWNRRYIDTMIDLYGFTDEAKNYYKQNINFNIKNPMSPTCHGGGFWKAHNSEVYVDCAQHEGTLHEMSHAWWEPLRQDESKRVSLVQDMLRLASMDPEAPENQNYSEAIKFARVYRDGHEGWSGMFCMYNTKERSNSDRCAPVKNSYTDEEIILYTSQWKIIDHEIFAGFSSWTMGKLSTGEHKLVA